MDKKLYDLMDWAGIEEIVYSEAADPHKLLGPHITDDGLLISAFIPTAVMVTVRLASSGKEFPMELADEAVFAALIPRKNIRNTPCLWFTITARQKNFTIRMHFHRYIRSRI